MSTDAVIREAVERIVQGLQRDPGSAQGTTHATARIDQDLTCIVTEGAWTLTSDVPSSMGGAAAGPSPGVYGRAAVASCVAIGIKIIAARMNHHIKSVSVDVDADYDWRGDFGLDGVSPGFQQFRFTISVDSSADADATERIVAEGLRLSSWLNTLARKQLVEATLEIAGDQRRRIVLQMS
jgi:uncharacterized OsmC-like protein